MSEKALQVARNEILKVIQMHYPSFSGERAIMIANQVLDAIDWNNSALMHKDIAWITKSYISSL